MGKVAGGSIARDDWYWNRAGHAASAEFFLTLSLAHSSLASVGVVVRNYLESRCDLSLAKDIESRERLGHLGT